LKEDSYLLCIAGGGTGGHVFPALTLADIARRRWPQLQVSFIGAERGLEARLLPARGEQVLLLSMHSVQGAGPMQKLRVLAWELPGAILRIWRQWRAVRPRLVVGVGGYASVAGVVAALLRRIPVMLYEQNAVPGMVNRNLARFSQGILLGFAEAAERLPREKCVYAGNLVSRALSRVHWQAHTPPGLVVLGGSQGAGFLNEVAPAACRELKQKGRAFTVTHVAGEGAEYAGTLAAAYRDAGIDAEVIEFCDDMPALYAKGDLMVARAGAMTVSEAAAVGMPAIFIPLPHAADNHQFFNARTLACPGAAVVVEQDQCDVDTLAGHIERLMFDTGHLEKMSRAAVKSVPENGGARLLAMLERWLGAPA